VIFLLEVASESGSRLYATLQDRLRDAVTAVQGEALCPMQFCEWTKL
jgi:hypothetical protein